MAMTMIMNSCSAKMSNELSDGQINALTETNKDKNNNYEDEESDMDTENKLQTTKPPSGPESGSQSERYLEIEENKRVAAEVQDTVTFSLKVDTAAYSNISRYISNGEKPPKDAVRTEEMINYFKYEGGFDFSEGPFSVYTEVGDSPFDKEKKMAFIRVKAKDIDKSKLKNSNLVFLIDISGSMDSYDKLPLLKSAFSMLTETLTENDKVSIVTYAGSSEIVLDGISGDRKTEILNAINKLSPEGSTAGADGIKTAYNLAQKNFKQNGNNRVILATDGDFNVGISSTSELSDFIASKRDTGVYLSVLGFGTGNIRDDIMETLSKNGNGNYAYIDSVHTAKKVLVDEIAANLYTVANDVKTQVVFNPVIVSNYRLIGYENRKLKNEDFENDKKDAGEIGAGTDVIALFEITLAKSQSKLTNQDKLFDVKIRYKNPGESESRLITKKAGAESIKPKPGTDFGFACAVAAFGHLLRGSEYLGNATIGSVINLAEANKGKDADGYRYEFIGMARKYEKI